MTTDNNVYKNVPITAGSQVTNFHAIIYKTNTW